jgi:hypothetical protein
MVIESTRLSGAANGRVPVELGEWLGGTGASTPVPQAHSDSTGRSPGIMLPWVRPVRATSNAVQYLTGGVQ